MPEGAVRRQAVGRDPTEAGPGQAGSGLDRRSLRARASPRPARTDQITTDIGSGTWTSGALPPPPGRRPGRPRRLPRRRCRRHRLPRRCRRRRLRPRRPKSGARPRSPAPPASPARAPGRATSLIDGFRFSEKLNTPPGANPLRPEVQREPLHRIARILLSLRHLAVAHRHEQGLRVEAGRAVQDRQGALDGLVVDRAGGHDIRDDLGHGGGAGGAVIAQPVGRDALRPRG